MLLLEFAAQGIRGVAPAGGRAALRPGYNVVNADGAALRRLLESLLQPDPHDLETLPRAPGGPGTGPVRAGLTLVGADRITYRLVRDFTAGCQLHRFDAEKRSFAIVSQDLAEIAAFLLGTGGVPSAARLALFGFAAAELPSKAGGGGLPSAALPSAALTPARTAFSPEQARKRLGELKAELEKAGAAEKLQYQLDGLQSRLFKLEEALKDGQKLHDGLAQVEAERAALEPVAAVAASLGDPVTRLAAFDKASGKRDEAVARVAAEREALAEAESAGRPQPFWQAPGFMASAGLGLVLLVVGSLGQASEVRYVALLDLPAFAWAAFVAFRWVGALESWERVGRRHRVIDDWEKKVADQFQRDASQIQAALKTLGLGKPSELKDQLERLADADRAVAEWKARLVDWEASPETGDAVAQKAKVEESLRDVETQLSSEAGGFVRDARTVEAEIERLEADLASPPPPPPPPSAPVAAPAPVRAPPAAGGDPLRGLLERAAAELGGSPASVARTVSQRASQALAGMTLNRLAGVGADDRGNVQVTVAGRPTPALTLPPADRDLIYLAIKLGLLEQALAASKTVVLMEDAFAGLSDAARRTAGRLLKQLAKAGQVIHATTDPAFRESADHQA